MGRERKGREGDQGGAAEKLGDQESVVLVSQFPEGAIGEVSDHACDFVMSSL